MAGPAKTFGLLGQKLQSVHDDLSLSGDFFLSREIRVAGRIRDGLSAGNSGCAYRLGNRGNRTDVGCRDACLFDLFNYCCTATCTGSSGTRQDNAFNTCCEQILGHLLTELGSIGN